MQKSDKKRLEMLIVKLGILERYFEYGHKAETTKRYSDEMFFDFLGGDDDG